MDITPEEVLEILFTGGHVELPPFLQDDDTNDDGLPDQE